MASGATLYRAGPSKHQMIRRSSFEMLSPTDARSMVRSTMSGTRNSPVISTVKARIILTIG
jgi:hypothetical protein